jgi:hypothetical protein
MSGLLDDIGFKALTKVEEDQLDNLVSETIFNRVVTRIAQQYGEKHAVDIASLLSNGSETEVNQFLADNHIDWDDLADKELKNYYQDLTTAKEILTTPDA